VWRSGVVAWELRAMRGLFLSWVMEEEKEEEEQQGRRRRI